MALPASGKFIQPSLKLKELTDDEIVNFSQEKIDKLTNNVNYPAPFPEFEAMQFALIQYIPALAKAEDGTTADTEDKNEKRELLEEKLIALAIRCSQIANGRMVVFLTSGFEARKQAEPPHLLPAPENLQASGGIVEQSVDLEWEPVDGAKTYVVQITETPQNNNSWGIVSPNNGGMVTRSNTSVNGLVSGKKYWFRVAALNAVGLGPFSEPAERIPQ